MRDTGLGGIWGGRGGWYAEYVRVEVVFGWRSTVAPPPARLFCGGGCVPKVARM